jgi:hypothetical protein
MEDDRMNDATETVASWLTGATAAQTTERTTPGIDASAKAQWAVVEMMGHRRVIGLLSEVEFGAGKVMRLDVLDADGKAFAATQFIGNGSIYAITLVAEELAREQAAKAGGYRRQAMVEYSRPCGEADEPW